MAEATTTPETGLVESAGHPHGALAWATLMTPDLGASNQFYAALFGWDYVDAEAGGFPYANATLHGKPVAGLGAMNPEQAQAGPAFWKVYLAADDVHAAVAATRAAGGTVVSGPFDVPGSGPVAVLRDSSGGEVTLMTAGFGAAYSGGPGVVSWLELYTRDVAAAAAFYRAVLGWSTEPAEFQGLEAAACHRAGQPVSMILPIPPAMGDMPTAWAIYIWVADVPAAVMNVQVLGGSLLAGPMESAGFPYAVVADPQGAEFYIASSGA